MNQYLYNCQLLSLNNRLINKKRFIKSQKISKALVDIEYFSVSSWIKKSTSEHNLQKDEKSLQTLQECQNNLKIQDSRLLHQMGNREFALGNFQKALEYLQSYNQLNPNCKRSKVQISQILFRLGQVEESEQRVLNFLEEPDLTMEYLVVLRTLMVQIQHKKQNLKKMEEYIDLLLENEPNDSFSLVYQAELFMQKKEKQEDAIKQLRRLRLLIYKERNFFSQQSFQDLINIIQKYEYLLKA